MKVSSRDTQAIANAIADRQPFTTHGSLHGGPASNGTGRLPSDWARTMQARSHVIDYVVYSYATPRRVARLGGWLDPAGRVLQRHDLPPPVPRCLRHRPSPVINGAGLGRS
jgi:hypothetical protein